MKKFCIAGTFSEAAASEARIGQAPEKQKSNKKKSAEDVGEVLRLHAGTSSHNGAAPKISEYQRLMSSFPSDQFEEPGTPPPLSQAAKKRKSSDHSQLKSPNKEQAALVKDTAKYNETCRHKDKCVQEQLQRCSPYCSSLGNAIGRHVLGQGVIGGCLTCITYVNRQLPAKRQSKKQKKDPSIDEFEL